MLQSAGTSRARCFKTRHRTQANQVLGTRTPAADKRDSMDRMGGPRSTLIGITTIQIRTERHQELLTATIGTGRKSHPGATRFPFHRGRAVGAAPQARSDS